MNDPSQATPPTEDTIASDTGSASDVPMPFSQRAAKISCCASFTVYVLGGLSIESPLLYGLLLVAGFAAFGLGILGIIGGVRRGATATIMMATLGAVLSGLLLAPVAWFALAR